MFKGQFHISTQELLDAVIKADRNTKSRAKKKMKQGEPETEGNIEKEARDELESEAEIVLWLMLRSFDSKWVVLGNCGHYATIYVMLRNCTHIFDLAFTVAWLFVR